MISIDSCMKTIEFLQDLYGSMDHRWMRYAMNRGEHGNNNGAIALLDQESGTGLGWRETELFLELSTCNRRI